ncbi:hypothetical protein AAHA92_26952 [Salvia divinorum]|uniref:Uncharacterized protein n=1 Tax=Salvia divinorum TaxID=28513 RepID=A0ABD1G514_SALDI
MGHKFTVVGGVVILNQIKSLTALTGCTGCLFYSYSLEMNSKYGVKLSDRLTRFMTGTVTLMAGFTAYDLYAFNKEIVRIGEMDKTECAKMAAGKLPKWYIKSITGSLILGAGAVVMAAATGYEMFSFHKDFVKKRAMEDNSANPSV